MDKHQFEIPREQQLPAYEQSTTEGSASATILDGQPPTTANEERSIQKNFWPPWYTALKHDFPIYLATHLAFFVITCLSFLFMLKDFSWQALPTRRLANSCAHWETTISPPTPKYGYTDTNAT